MKNIEPQIITLAEKKLIGKRLTMSFARDKTEELWKSFMPRRHDVPNALTTDLISMQIYPEHFNFEAETAFEKWAAIEVSDFKNMGEGLESFVLKGGLYAVFDYKGSSADTKIFEYIFGSWLPKSVYQLDNRPHFEILGKRYKNNHPDSEERIAIPIKPKSK